MSVIKYRTCLRKIIINIQESLNVSFFLHLLICLYVWSKNKRSVDIRLDPVILFKVKVRTFFVYWDVLEWINVHGHIEAWIFKSYTKVNVAIVIMKNLYLMCKIISCKHFHCIPMSALLLKSIMWRYFKKAIALKITNSICSFRTYNSTCLWKYICMCKSFHHVWIKL